MRQVVCPYCDQPAKQVTGEKVYPHRRDLWSKRFYLCEPCQAWVGCYGSGKPLGRLANAELRRAKMSAHNAFDGLWKYRGMSRSEAYRWLAEKLGIEQEQCHIGMFDVDQCRRVAAVSREKHNEEFI